jgi:shikimate dehydrogenase
MNSPPPITGKTRLLALIADPVVQAGSPALINAELLQRGQFGDFVMLPLQIPRDALAMALAGLHQTGNFCGAVVSMPHKQAIVPLLDSCSARVQQQGACNVIRRTTDGRLHGDMLDGSGFVHSLLQAGHGVGGQRILLLGAGGAARSIAFALAEAGAAALGIGNRTPEHARQLAAAVKATSPACSAVALEGRPAFTGAWDIVVNATCLGMQADDAMPLPASALHAGLLVADIVISPQPTALLQAAKALGCRVHDGRQMLEAQKTLLLDFMLHGVST